MSDNDITNQMIYDEIKLMRGQLDKVRTETIPAIKTDVALLVQDGRTASKWHTMIGSFTAVLVSTLIGRYK